jgi:hypothetical protein
LEDFFYSIDFGELGSGGSGWTYLGWQFYIYDSQAEGTVPLYRFFSPTYGTHFYSTNFNEVGEPDWEFEGITGYIFSSQQSGTEAIRRWFKWVGGAPVHYYARANATDDALAIQQGWTLEGVTGYAPVCNSNCY